MRLAIIQDLINAYEAHDRDAFDRHLKRIEETLKYTGPVSGGHRCETHSLPFPCQDCVRELADWTLQTK